MSTDDSSVIVTTGATANSHRVYHRDFPEIRVEGETPAVAAEHLANQLAKALDSALTDWRRGSITKAIEAVKAFIAKES
ncbi:MAG: hypothetical protein NVSMB9_33750 [Isosphaeraceae bacterium]